VGHWPSSPAREPAVNYSSGPYRSLMPYSVNGRHWLIHTFRLGRQIGKFITAKSGELLLTPRSVRGGATVHRGQYQKICSSGSLTKSGCTNPYVGHFDAAVLTHDKPLVAIACIAGRANSCSIIAATPPVQATDGTIEPAMPNGSH
jgi:hypothetical protein